VLTSCVAATWRQVGYWHDTRTLFEHALRSTSGNFVAEVALARVSEREGDLDAAIARYREALRLEPGYVLAHRNLARLLVDRGDEEAALPHLGASLRLRPDDPETHLLLGLAMERRMDFEAAVEHYRRGLRLLPERAGARWRLGVALYRLGRSREAVAELRAALELDPDAYDPLLDLAGILATDPDPEIADPAEAVRLAEHLCRLRSFSAPEDLYVLSLAYASAGRRADAVEAALDAARLAREAGNAELAAKAESQARRARGD
jgi:tetratricopeptide (TPR) repeat protein